MREPAYRLIQLSLVGAGACAAAGAGLLLPDLIARRPVGVWPMILAGVTWLAAILLFVRSWRAADRLGRGVRAIRMAVLNLTADRDASLPDALPGSPPPEVEAMLGSLRLYQDEIVRERLGPDHRLVAVLGALASGVVVMTQQGQVSLLNGTARALLGTERARVGTSLFAALERGSVLAAVASAAGAERPVEVELKRLDDVALRARVVALPQDEGAILIFPPVELEHHRPGVEFDLQLHDVPPARTALELSTPLDELPFVVMDTETTGLDTGTARVVSVGAVCGHGTRLYRNRMLDDLVDPGVPIPPASAAVHGITDAMVADAPAFPEVWADFQRLTRNRVVVGHNVPFDLTVLREECRRHEQPWTDLIFLDTMRLASLLNPLLQKWDLETLAAHYQTDIHGRHTALGDALVTAEIFTRMLPRLRQQGCGTLGQLLRMHCRDAVDVIAGQRERGWIVNQPTRLREGGVSPASAPDSPSSP
ncbi:MAG TPA: exonuclease domain-containing protein [Candidatus Krumholzibacteria bacterium]|nr:exonuclease domain-containing protein [Candidatus Krumholzibacteria bacterium]